MKISIFDRFLLSIYTLAIILVSLFLLLISLGAAIGLISINAVGGYIASIIFNRQSIVILIAVALLFLIVSIKLLFSGVRKAKPHSALLKSTDLGIIRVSISTLDSLAQKAVRSFNEVKDAKSFIVPEPDGIRVQIRIMVMPDVKLPELTVNIQQKIKEYIESISGIAVKEVRIYIDNIVTAQKAKVE